MTKDELYKIISKPKSECDGFEIHIRHLWDSNQAKRIFTITGLDVSDMLSNPIESFGHKKLYE